MIIIHHLDHSRSRRILWLLEELGLAYEIKKYQRDPKTLRAPKDLRQIHPLGKAPVLQDGNVVIAESGAIVEYVLDTYGNGRLRPAAGGEAYRRYQEWMHFAEGSAMPPMVLKLVTREMPRQAPFLLRPVMNKVAAQMNSMYVDKEVVQVSRYMENTLANLPWFAGQELTGADIMMSFPVEAAVDRAPGGPYPNLQRFMQAVQARPAYQQAVAKGGI